MKMDYDEWVELVNKGKYCDMVLNILKDWKEEREELRDEMINFVERVSIDPYKEPK
jgi:hypothetical protein